MTGVVRSVAAWQTARSVDELTLERARRGDPIAQTRFVEAHQAAVWALLSRMLGRGSPEVPDLAQETFLKALRSLPSFDPKGSATISTWVLTIAARLAIDAMRRQKRWVISDAEPERVDDGAVERQEARDLAHKVEAAMTEIGAEARAILVLRAHHDLDYPEIAAALELEAGTVKSRLSRARSALKKALFARGVEV